MEVYKTKQTRPPGLTQGLTVLQADPSPVFTSDYHNMLDNTNMDSNPGKTSRNYSFKNKNTYFNRWHLTTSCQPEYRTSSFYVTLCGKQKNYRQKKKSWPGFLQSSQNYDIYIHLYECLRKWSTSITGCYKLITCTHKDHECPP